MTDRWAQAERRAEMTLRGGAFLPNETPPNADETREDVPSPTGLEDYGLPSHDGRSDHGGEGDDRERSAAALALVSAANWPDEAPAPVSWVVNDRLPRGDVATLDGDGGLGKTMAALQLAAAVARGASDWLGMLVNVTGDVLFLSAEEPEAEIRRRVYRIAKRGGCSMSELKRLNFWFPADTGDCLFATQTAQNTARSTPLFDTMAECIVAQRPVLVLIDNVAAIYGGDQNNRAMVRAFMNRWRAVARASDACILLLNHPSLSGLNAGTGRGGSMDWRNAVRAALHLKPAPDQADADRGVRVLECVKNNYAPLGPPTRLEWEEGVLTVEGTASPHHRAAHDAGADERFLAHLDTRNGLGRDVSDKSGKNYAPKVFEDMEKQTGPNGYTKRKFAEAMERLFAARKIELQPIGPPSANRKRIVRAV